MIDEKALAEVVHFHGHMCPGLAIGVRAAEVALREIGPHSVDEEVVCQVETDMCAVDAIQFMTGCTFGKGNLIHRDWGKNAFTFWRRSDGKALRIRTRLGVFGSDSDAERQRLFAAVRQGSASPAEGARFQELHLQRASQVLEAPEADILEFFPIDSAAPAVARIHDSITCAECGEPTMATRVEMVADRPLCPPCREEVPAALVR